MLIIIIMNAVQKSRVIIAHRYNYLGHKYLYKWSALSYNYVQGWFLAGLITYDVGSEQYTSAVW